MATVNDQTQLAGLFKEVYGTNVVDAFAFAAPLASRLMKFDEQEAGLGNKYHQPVDLQLEHSFTGSAAGTVPTLLAVNAGIMQDAQAQGINLYGRSAVSYEAIARAAEGGKKAFESATKRVVKRLGMSALKRLEIQLLHGGAATGIGLVSSISGTSTTRALVLTDATWAAGLWAGMVGMTLDAFAAADLTTKVNTNAAIVVASVTTSTKTINISGNSSDMTTLDSTTNITLFPETGKPTTEISGLDAWCNMSSTWFNIPTSTYDLWNANTYSTSTGILSFAKLMEACGQIAAYGSVQKLVAVVSPKAFEVLNTDQAALRKYDASYKPSKGETGVEGLVFHSQVGPVEILPHQFQKDGYAHLFAPDEALRTGATDITFIQRHGTGEKLIMESATTPAGEMRTYSSQQLFIEQPRHLNVLSGITY